MVEQASNAEAKASLQPPSYISKINFKYSKSHYLLSKKDKKNTYWEHCNEVSKDKEKAKSHNPSSANQPQTQVSKWRHKSWRVGNSSTGVNATEITKIDKDKTKDISHIKCYTCKQKDHYVNK